MASSIPDSKRRRRTTTSPNDDNVLLSIDNLPRDHLTAIADYLPQTSRALFAVALSSTSEAFVTKEGVDGKLSEASKAVTMSSSNESWENLDFADVGDLAARLNDNDVHALLLVIDAKNKMKRICLTGCNNFVGYGLEPLRESVVLQSIDIPLQLLENKMSTADITPILDSIAEMDGNSLREIKMSNVVNAKKGKQLRNFMAKFNGLLDLGIMCKCCVADPQSHGTIQPASSTCFECFEGCCDDCSNYDYDNRILTCSRCDLSFCEFHGGEECYGCNTFHCKDCAENVEVGSAQACDRCNYSFCTDCCVKDSISQRGRAGYCKECLGLHFPTLARRHEKQILENTILQRKGSRNDEMAEENKQLREEVEELRKKMSSGLGILA